MTVQSKMKEEERNQETPVNYFIAKMFTNLDFDGENISSGSVTRAIVISY